MRLLWVKAGKLLPVDTGGRIRSYNILRHLANGNAVTVWSYYFGERDRTYEGELREVFPGAVALHAGNGRGQSGTTALSEAVDYARALPASAPYAVTKFTSADARARIARFIRDEHPDVVVCDFLSASLTVPRLNGTASVLFQHNVESALWERQARHEANPLKRAAFALEARKMRRYETRTIQQFDTVIAVSDNDRDLFQAMAPGCRVTVVPTGVDVQAYSQAAGQESSSPIVLFLGSMDWEANIDAVEYFCRDVWPRVCEAVPDARFHIVGRNPHLRVTRLASESVVITGGVPSVIPYLADSAVMVVPLRIGGGTRLKIYEAMAAGRAIVSTSVGAEGLDVQHQRDIVLADTASEFADAVIAVLRSPDYRQQLASGASATAARYDWSAVAVSFEKVLESVCRPTRRSTAEIAANA